MLTANMLLTVFFVSGALADCPHPPSLFITTPKEMKALSGSCLRIPCTFRVKAGDKFDAGRKIIGVWIKSDPRFEQFPDNVIFNSSGTDNIYPMNITGNLSQKNCTTLFSSLLTNYTDSYFFRIENELYRATANCDSLQIKVTDSPGRPSIEILGDLKEKASVTITCSALTPCPHSPPELTWNLQQDPHNNVEENTNGTFTTKIQQTITLSDRHDGKNITCSARYTVNEGEDVKTAEETETLSVSYAPKDTSVSISPSGLVSAGSWVNLTCSSRAKPPVRRFTWFKNGKDGAMTVSEGQFYSFNVTDGGVYYCVATNDLGNQTAEINLSITGESSSPWGAVAGGIIGIIVFICVLVAIWWLKLKCSTSQQTMSLTAEESARSTEKEDIHYGEIDFSKLRPQPSSSSDSVLDSGQQQDTLYAQVKVFEKDKRLTQAADGPEDLYAQVKKK